MRAILLTTLLISSVIGFSQSPKSLITKEIKANEVAQSNHTKTLTLNLRHVSKNNQGLLKDELIGFHEKVISLDLNEFNETLIFIHNGLLLKEEVLIVLDKHNINKASIISYE